MGMRTLREDGIRKVLAGLTTAEEVIRTTLGDES
jgi:type II secretory ATPase GspE/PulE/Tfp pilus assembly ATPase PilB-like protein